MFFNEYLIASKNSIIPISSLHAYAILSPVPPAAARFGQSPQVSVLLEEREFRSKIPSHAVLHHRAALLELLLRIAQGDGGAWIFSILDPVPARLTELACIVTQQCFLLLESGVRKRRNSLLAHPIVPRLRIPT